MKRTPFSVVSVIVLLSFLLLSVPVQAVTILYDAIDLSDDLSEDLWRYDYYVSEYPAEVNHGFTIYFDRDSYSNLTPITTLNLNWDVLVTQPDPNLPGDGMYDALALSNEATLRQAFTVQFVWLGSGAPGSQEFELYQLPGDGSIRNEGWGWTTPRSSSVPEPGTLSLLAVGLYGLSRLRKRRIAFHPFSATE